MIPTPIGIDVSATSLHVKHVNGAGMTLESPALAEGSGALLSGRAGRRQNRTTPLFDDRDTLVAALRDVAGGLGACCSVLAVPPHSDDQVRQRVRDAAIEAGLNPLRIVNQPTAACIAAGLDKELDDGNEHPVAVCDWGAAGFRAARIGIEDGIFELMESIEVPVEAAALDGVLAAAAGLDDAEEARELKHLALANTPDRRLSTPRALHALRPTLTKLVNDARRILRCAERVLLLGGMFEGRAMRDAFLAEAGLALTPLRPSAAAGCANLAEILRGPAEELRAQMPAVAGLRDAVSGHTLPVLRVRADVLVLDSAAEVTLAQTFANQGAEAVEVVYTLPVGEDAAVAGMVVEHAGARLEARCVDRQAASDLYDDALAEGDGAYLAEQATKGVLELLAGNVPAGAEVTVTVTLALRVATRGDALELALPPKWLPPYGAYDVEMAVRLQPSAPLAALECPSHDDAVLTADEVHLTLDRAPTRPVVIKARTEAVRHARATLERHPEHGTTAALVTLVPSIAGDASGAEGEYVFLLDRSCSMSDGDRMPVARACVAQCLADLPDGAHFNVVSFGSGFEMLHAQSVPLTRESRAAAALALSTMEADMGGTQLLAPMRQLLDRGLRARTRSVLVITDGEVSRPLDVARAVSSSADTRVFTFGVGSGAGRETCERLAHAGGGKAVFCATEDLAALVREQLRAARSPAVSQLRLEGAGALVAPRTLRPLYDGEAYHVLCSEPTARRVELVGVDPSGGEVRFGVDLPSGAAREGRLVHAMLALEAVRDLEEAGAPRAEMVAAALAGGIVSSVTSFIVVEKRVGAARMSSTSSSARTQDLLLLDVTPLSFSVSGDEGRTGLVVLPRNTTIPTRRAVSLCVHTSDRGEGRVELYEGERASPQDNNFLDALTLRGLPPSSAVEVRVELELDCNGILFLRVPEQGEVVVTNEQGRLSAAEIEEMIRQAEQFKAEDAAKLDAAKLRNELQLRLRSVESVAARAALALATESTTAGELQGLLGELRAASAGGAAGGSAGPGAGAVAADEVQIEEVD